MAYKHGVPVDNGEETGKLRVLRERANSIWKKLEDHAKNGRCTCHIDEHGCIHILNACVIGRVLNEEYDLTIEYIKEYENSK